MVDVESLYHRYGRDVYRFSLYLCGDRDLAEDLTSETFLRVWTARETVRLSTVKAFLFTIARNLYLQSRRRSARREELTEALPDPKPDPARRTEDSAALTGALSALRRIPETDRAALLMQADGVPYEEIARALGVSVVAAKVKVHRARRKLAEFTMRR